MKELIVDGARLSGKELLRKVFTDEEIEFLIIGMDRLAQSEQATYASDNRRVPYEAWWKSMEQRAKRIGTFATELK